MAGVAFGDACVFKTLFNKGKNQIFHIHVMYILIYIYIDFLYTFLKRCLIKEKIRFFIFLLCTYDLIYQDISYFDFILDFLYLIHQEQFYTTLKIEGLRDYKTSAYIDQQSVGSGEGLNLLIIHT